jgi:hypothetical protein
MWMRKKWLMVPALVGVATSAGALASFNFGLFRDHQLDAHSIQLFGIVQPVEASSTASVDRHQRGCRSHVIGDAREGPERAHRDR